MKTKPISRIKDYMRRPIIFYLLYFSIINFVSAQKPESTELILLKNKKYLSIQACSEKIFRIRIKDKVDFQPSLRERYGIVKTEWNRVTVSSESKNGKKIVKTADFEFIIDDATGTFSVSDSKNNSLIDRIGFLNESSPMIMNLAQSLNKYFGTFNTGGGIIGDDNYTGEQKEQMDMPNAEVKLLIEMNITDQTTIQLN